jgi:murein L,D-transpeptidase YcbB/YkuD
MRRLFEVLFIVLLSMCSCSKNKSDYPFSQLSYDELDSLRNNDYTVSNRRVRSFIDSFRIAERDTDYIDVLTNRYYAERHPYLWINKWGTDLRCDTVLEWLANVNKLGLPEKKFYLKQIRQSLERVRNLDFDKTFTASRTMATLEYYLTKSYMRYSSGQRFGFVNPNKLFNRMDKVEKDSTNSPYKTLFDIPIDLVNKDFFIKALDCIQKAQVNTFMTAVQPTSSLYEKIYNTIQNTPQNSERYKVLIVNLERSRWRMHESEDKKYVVVNLPSQQLMAMEQGASTLNMNACVGSPEHQTPMLTSRIAYLELNPYWIIPQSIVKRDIIKHVGDTAYFSSKRFKIVDRAVGNFISPLDVTSSMLLSNKYLVRQDKGEDNSLGRMIFRFPNPFSIYMHDTNEHDVFSQNWRTVSHGCIRLEKPFDLALFLLKDKDDIYIDRIRLALDMEPLTDEGHELKENHHTKKLKRCDFKPTIPLFVIYFTCYPDVSGKLTYYPDIYKYDEPIWTHLNAEK